MQPLHFSPHQHGFQINTGRRLWTGLVLAILAVGPATAWPLRVVTTGAPAINCVFDASCRVVVTDTTADIVLAGGGTGFLQSRTFQGQPGAPAELFTGYEYRIDLSNAVAVTGGRRHDVFHRRACAERTYLNPPEQQRESQASARARSSGHTRRPRPLTDREDCRAPSAGGGPSRPPAGGRRRRTPTDRRTGCSRRQPFLGRP